MSNNIHEMFAEHILATLAKAGKSPYSIRYDYCGDTSKWLSHFIKDLKLPKFVKVMERGPLGRNVAMVPKGNSMLVVGDSYAMYNSEDHNAQMYFQVPRRSTGDKGGISRVWPQVTISTFTPEGAFLQAYKVQQDPYAKKAKVILTTTFYSKDTLDYITRGPYGGHSYNEIKTDLDNRAGLIEERVARDNMFPDAVSEELIYELPYSNDDELLSSKELETCFCECIGSVSNGFLNREEFLNALRAKLSDQFDFPSTKTI